MSCTPGRLGRMRAHSGTIGSIPWGSISPRGGEIRGLGGYSGIVDTTPLVILYACR